MLWLYRLLFLPALLVLAPSYLWHMRRRGGYSRGFSHRFGSLPRVARKSPGVRRIWLQAVSVGEMLAIGPLLEKFKDDGIEVFLTTTTSTGYRLASDRYRGLVVDIGYFPIDWWLFSARAWNRVDPDLAIIAEGERWPEHMRQARNRGVPVLCINARLSDRTYHRMKRFPGVARLSFDGVTRFLTCSTHDEARFREFGLVPERVVNTGNIKLDLVIVRLTEAERTTLRGELGLRPGFVLLGSSTWPGEEEALIETYRAVRADGLACSLLIVPRHAERRTDIERTLQGSKLSFHFRSTGHAPSEVDVAVADTTGELRKLTQLADVVFVGKSLGEHTEGQTPVEAAALEKPILFGPGMSNFRRISEELIAHGAAHQVATPAALTAAVTQLLREPAQREALAKAASAWHRENAGAVTRTWEHIRAELATLPPRKDA